MPEENTELAEKIAAFKEKTGISDELIEGVVNGGDVAFFAGEEGREKYELKLDVPDGWIAEDGRVLNYKVLSPPYEASWEESLDEPYDDRMSRLRTETLELLTSDKVVGQLEQLEQDAGFTPSQTAAVLQGEGIEFDDALDQLSDTQNRVKLYLLKEKSDVTVDEIIEKLADAIENLGYESSAENIDDRMYDIFDDEFPHRDKDMMFPDMNGNNDAELEKIFRDPKFAEKLNIPEEVAEKLEHLKSETGLSDEQVRSIILDPEIEKQREIPENKRSDDPEEMRRSAIRYLAEDSSIEQWDEATQRTGFTQDEIAEILEGTGVEAVSALEQLTTRSMAVNLERLEDHLEKEQVIEGLKGTGEHLDLAAKLLAGRLNGYVDRDAASDIRDEQHKEDHTTYFGNAEPDATLRDLKQRMYDFADSVKAQKGSDSKGRG